MSASEPAFSVTEYRQRIAKTRASMAARGLDLLIVSDPSNMAWLTGYDGWSFYVHQAVLLALDGEPIWWGRGIDANGARRTVFMAEQNIVAYDDSYVQNPQKHPMQDLVAVLNRLGWQRGRIGVEMDNYYFSAAAYQTLEAGLTSASLADATGLVNWMRAIKSEREIVFMQRAARIVEHMHRVILDKANPGVRKNDLVADIYHAAITGADGHWGDYPALVPLTPSGLNATAAHLTWDDSPMREGEATFFEIAGVYRRYHCPQCRTVFLGKPPKHLLDAEQAVLEALDAGLQKAKPGNRCEDVANAFNATLNRRGFSKDNRCGYPIGLSYPPDWGERTMSFRSGDTGVMQPGMTFHFMPALWMDDTGLEITESILITESGFEFFCDTPRQLFVK